MSRSRRPESPIVLPTTSAPSWTTSSATPYPVGTWQVPNNKLIRTGYVQRERKLERAVLLTPAPGEDHRERGESQLRCTPTVDEEAGTGQEGNHHGQLADHEGPLRPLLPQVPCGRPPTTPEGATEISG